MHLSGLERFPRPLMVRVENVTRVRGEIQRDTGEVLLRDVAEYPDEVHKRGEWKKRCKQLLPCIQRENPRYADEIVLIIRVST